MFFLKQEQMQPGVVFLLLFFMALTTADYLQNPDFEISPSDLTQNSSSTSVMLTENNTIPGWSFEGTITYVKSSQTMALPGNGHGIQLGLDGKINQTFIANPDYMHYILSFTLAPGGQNCSGNANMEVSAPDTNAVFSFKQHFGKEAWESYGLYLGSWGQEEPVNLVIESQAADSDQNSTCWPVIDMLVIKTLGTLVQGNDNLLLNGGFEFGPDFLSNSTDGILLDTASTPLQSALRHWSIAGTVKYIDSKHLFVPQGNAAVEIVSGVSAGIQTVATLTEGSEYILEFSLGDANDACEGNFIVGAQAGSTLQNFTLLSQGTGSAKKFNLTFKAGSSPTPIGFLSYTTSQTKDGMFCGPVVDDVILRASGFRTEIKSGLLVFLLLLAAIL